jgi:hypothetical protein
MLDAVFHALADPTPRAMLRSLAQRERSIGGLAAPFDRVDALLRTVLEQTTRCSREPSARGGSRGWIPLVAEEATREYAVVTASDVVHLGSAAVVRSDEIERCRKACSRSGYRARRALSTWYARTPTGMRLAELDLKLT